MDPSAPSLAQDDGPARVFPYEAAPPVGKKRWHVGTLAYSAGGLAALFCWLLWGDFAWSMKERSVTPVVQLLLKQFRASDLLTGLLLGTLPSATAMFLGPVVSYRSDRHRGRWGRRIPFLMIPTPVAALSMVCLSLSPWIGRAVHHALGGRGPGENATILLFFGFFWTTFEVSSIVAGSVFGGLINDVVPRPLLGRFYGLFRALSLIAGMIFNYWLLGKAEAHFVWVFLGIGLLYGGGFTLMCLKVKEGQYPPPPPAPEIRPSPVAGFLAAARLYLKECFNRPYYVCVFVALNVAALSNMPINFYSVFFAQSLGIGMGTYGKYIAATFMISLAMSYPLGLLADRFHPLRAGIVALALYALATLWGGLYAKDGKTFAAALIAHGVLSGTYGTLSASLGQRLFPHSKFAQFASASGLVGTLSYMLFTPTMGALLDRTHHVYRYTYFASSAMAAVGVAACLVVYVQFRRLGGPTHYIAPDEAEVVEG